MIRSLSVPSCYTTLLHLHRNALYLKGASFECPESFINGHFRTERLVTRVHYLMHAVCTYQCYAFSSSLSLTPCLVKKTDYSDLLRWAISGNRPSNHDVSSPAKTKSIFDSDIITVQTMSQFFEQSYYDLFVNLDALDEDERRSMTVL